MSAALLHAGETVGGRLRRLRLERDLSQRELARPGVSYAYIAGLFDGEGCVKVYSDGRQVRAALTITSLHRGVLDAVTETAGGKVYENDRFFEWKLHGLRGNAFAEALLPYAIIKRDQLLLYLEIPRGTRWAPLTDEQLREREEIVAAIAAAKRTSYGRAA